MADYIETLLAENEKVVINVKQHWIALIRFALQPILIAIGAVGGGAISLNFSGEDKLIRGILDTIIKLVALGLFAVAVVWLPIQIIRWKTRHYVLTNRRVIESAGMMRKTTVDAGLDKITDVSYEQPWLGTMLGYGDISVVTASGAPIDLDQIIGAIEFKKAIMEAQEALIRERAGMMMGGSAAAAAAVAAATVQSPVAAAAGLPGSPGVVPAAPAPVAEAPAPVEEPKASSPTEITAMLASLTDMKEAGTITGADFEAKKKELLDRL